MNMPQSPQTYKHFPHRRLWRARLGLLALACCLVSACGFRSEERISLPPTPQLFGSLPWGMVNVTYAKGYAEPRSDSAVVMALRGGDVVAILERANQEERLGAQTDYWYRVSLGEREFWLFGANMSLYGLEIQAKTASRIIEGSLFGEPGSRPPNPGN